MCGLAGILWDSDSQKTEIELELHRMAVAIKHRGPDDAGIWFNDHIGVGIAHCRLSIVDLSSAGHQPMVSVSNRYILAFNGEIYNHNELRIELSKLNAFSFSWKGHSDTEVLLACFDAWGFDATLKKLVGMFAISVFDCVENIFYLARDRIGEKPLYYGLNKGSFVFGSELKSIKAYSEFSPEINRDALALLLRYNYIPAPFTIYKGISKLLPGSYLRLNIKNSEWLIGSLPKPIRYWAMREVSSHANNNRLRSNEGDVAISSLEDLLKDSVKHQMEADVPLGVFLSGGIDSSLITALMQSQIKTQVKTFSIGFNELDYNESRFSKAVSNYLGTDHTEFVVTAEDALNIIPLLPTLYDEPFADCSQIPTFLVSKLASKHVKVALSGDGADELFGGYNRYLWTTKLWRNIKWVPFWIRKIISKSIIIFHPRFLDNINLLFHKFLPIRLQVSHLSDKIYKIADLLLANTENDIYTGLVSLWKDPNQAVIGVKGDSLLKIPRHQGIHENEHQMMYLDSISYLPDDILVKVDRASMGVSLEIRAPFLDHRVVEFAWKTPLSMKIRHNKSKVILREILYKYIPREMVDRPKMGFGVPIDSWLRGPLRGWAESLLCGDRLRKEGFFHVDIIRNKWAEHLSGKRNWQYQLWSVLMFQAWLEQQGDVR